MTVHYSSFSLCNSIAHAEESKATVDTMLRTEAQVTVNVPTVDVELRSDVATLFQARSCRLTFYTYEVPYF